MAGPYTPGNIELLRTKYNTDIKSIQLAKQVMKELVTVQTTNAGTDRFWRESVTELVHDSNIPRDAEFASDQVILDDLDIVGQKHGIESRVAWEDTIQPGPNLVERTTIRTGNRVARSVNTRIWNVLSEDQSASEIGTLATAATWNNATRANRIPHEDIAEAVSTVMDSELQEYVPDVVFFSPLDYAFVRTNDYVMSSFDSSGPALMEKGVMGSLLGLSAVVSPVITADYSLISETKKAVTWAELAPLTTDVERKTGKYYLFTAFEFGQAARTAPAATTLITNTQT